MTLTYTGNNAFGESTWVYTFPEHRELLLVTTHAGLLIGYDLIRWEDLNLAQRLIESESPHLEEKELTP